MLKLWLRAKVILSMMANTFYRFYKGYDGFEQMPLDSKYNRVKEFNKILIDFKAIKIKKERHDSKRSEL